MVCWAAQFGFLGVTNASQWQAAVALYMLGYIAYGITLVFYASVFPRLARNTPRTKEARKKLDEGTSTVEEYEKVEMLERNRLSSISTAHSNCKISQAYQAERLGGFLVTLVLNLSVLLPLASNSKVNNVRFRQPTCQVSAQDSTHWHSQTATGSSAVSLGSFCKKIDEDRRSPRTATGSQ